MERRGISIDRQVLFGAPLPVNSRKRSAALESEVRELAGEAGLQSRQSQGSSATSCSENSGPLRAATKDQDRPVVDRRGRVLDDLAEQGHCPAKKDSRVASGDQLKSTYHRRAWPGLRQSDHATAFHNKLCALRPRRPGRPLPSSEPNLQNIPIRSEEGPQDQARFSFATKGSQARLRPDYSQI